MQETSNPYRAPDAPLAASTRRPFPLGKFAAELVVLSIALFGCGMFFADQERMRSVGSAVLGLSAAVGGIAGICALVALVRGHRAAAPMSTGFGVLLAMTMLGGGAMALFGAAAALLATADFSRGRQLRRRGRVLLPRLRAHEGWSEVPLDPMLLPASDEERRLLASRWRDNGRTEHASVAAFARLTLDLMALGAPPELLRAAQRDADDEIAHAELCFSLARAIDGEPHAPAPFPEAARARTLSSVRNVALAQLAVDSLIDGALHEGVSARIVARLAKRCEDLAIRGVLKTIAADEGRHAAHGWDVVRYCLEEGGDGVARALEGALSMLPAAMRTAMPEPMDRGAWERYGLHGHALEAEEYAAARADVVRRTRALVAARRAHTLVARGRTNAAA